MPYILRLQKIHTSSKKREKYTKETKLITFLMIYKCYFNYLHVFAAKITNWLKPFKTQITRFYNTFLGAQEE